ncbi:MAG: T9SS type A sorting domain-containing protein [Saprospiraceae bacterium]
MYLIHATAPGDFSSTNEVDIDKVVIYPNPTTEKVFIDGINLDTDYELYHPNEQIVKGKTENQTVTLDSNGIFILKIKVNDAWMIRRIIKIE